jgi:hypothetical protein
MLLVAVDGILLLIAAYGSLLMVAVDVACSLW